MKKAAITTDAVAAVSTYCRRTDLLRGFTRTTGGSELDERRSGECHPLEPSELVEICKPTLSTTRAIIPSGIPSVESRSKPTFVNSIATALKSRSVCPQSEQWATCASKSLHWDGDIWPVAASTHSSS